MNRREHSELALLLVPAPPVSCDAIERVMGEVDPAGAPVGRGGAYRVVAAARAATSPAVPAQQGPRLRARHELLPEASTADADTLSRFAVEARAVAALGHPNIVQLPESGA